MGRFLRIARFIGPLGVAVLLLIITVAACGVRPGASPLGELSGRVVDASGDGVARVAIEVDPGPVEGIGIQTSDDGTYSMPPVIPGRPRVVPMRDGRALADPKFVDVAAGQHVTVDFQLEQ